MQDHQIRTYRPEDRRAVIALWQECGLVVPWNNPEADIARKCADSPELFFVAESAETLIATCMAGFDGHRGWIYYLAVAISQRRRGIAHAMMEHAESKLIELGCPKIDLMVRDNNSDVIAFYQNIGYQTDPVRVLSKRLIEDKPDTDGQA